MEEYYDLGDYRRSITISSPQAQTWFNRGLVWSYSFNHEEGKRCFIRATEADPNCAMAFWGIAYAIGPNYNKAWSRFDRQDLKASIETATSALSRAAELAEQATPVEKAIIKALSARFPVGNIPDDLGVLNLAYADALRPVYQAYPNDLEVITLFVEALMCISPRALWSLETGKPTGPHTVEAREILESAMAKHTDGPENPAFPHLYIHLMEMSPFAELALPGADRLRRLVPDGSHMLHMPTHIDIACGDYRRAVDSNHEAMVSDDKYFARETGSVIYTMYRAHNVYAKTYAAIMSGRSKDAICAAKKLWDIVDVPLLSIRSPPMADWVESFLGALPHALVRFGRWEEILSLELPTDKELFCSTTAMIHYARGIAFSVLGRTDEADTELTHFEAARAAVPETRLNSIPTKESDVLNVGGAMLKGELEYRKGNYDIAFSSLRKAVELEDALPYSDPHPWMQPVRHALGALLLEQGHVTEAETVYREDLGLSKSFPRRKARPNNVWGLHGLYECLVRGGKEEEALLIQMQRDIAMACADVAIAASCYCRLSVTKSTCCRD
ncbi:hypothetical protein ASPWEDRAFT_43956 [Aspergillus wentii DTO 134E9]|uniref:MalT-like TPR region domain-containing protein n=1 Tax=Aspergillus wentii DTO 134E9 TaxID=1073089 RepID=A0A1L9RAJ8_ASPWE|nr:uncharacterized protein ASPWEDRAFT_43956 [Aspergillus wentii DTO 134E9]KAI9934525.1 hypothetical protein MW887_000139 [Aspergillus wentii]OJJ31941.1 hypothetical protein ASPWEDRAFT_43956 [Aspergillus wentii DTO 134E9]